LRFQANDAIAACNTAVQQFPSELRFQYQLARALEFSNPDAALERQLKLEHLQYGAAYDNAGSIFVRKGNYAAAATQFKLGVEYGDPDAMVSLAEMIKKGRADGNYIALYQRAANMGHQGAQETLEQEQQQQLELQQQTAAQMEKQRRAMEILGTILQNFRR
jgi:TPR repeat protein